MLNISGLSEGVVIDHLKAGSSMDIYHYLELEKYPNCTALIMNAKSSKMGKKDIIKIEGSLEGINLDVLGIIDPDITLNIVSHGTITEKKSPSCPDFVTSVIRCKNPRCITTIEQELPHRFRLTNPASKTYRCIYCEQEFKRK